MDLDAPNPTKHKRNQGLTNFEEILLNIEEENVNLDPENLLLWLSNMTENTIYKFAIMEGDSPKSQFLRYVMEMQTLLNEKEERIGMQNEIIKRQNEDIESLKDTNSKQARKLKEIKERFGLQDEDEEEKSQDINL